MNVKYDIDRYIFWENWKELRYSYYLNEMTDDEVLLVYLELDYDKEFIAPNMLIKALNIIEKACNS